MFLRMLIVVHFCLMTGSAGIFVASSLLCLEGRTQCYILALISANVCVNLNSYCAFAFLGSAYYLVFSFVLFCSWTWNTIFQKIQDTSTSTENSGFLSPPQNSETMLLLLISCTYSCGPPSCPVEMEVTLFPPVNTFNFNNLTS